MALRAVARTSFSEGSGWKTGTSIWVPSVASCWMAAGLTRSRATSIGERGVSPLRVLKSPGFLSRRASLAEEVVLPAPFRPTMRMRVGLPKLIGALSPPRSAVS
jgi:hypothetical protein